MYLPKKSSKEETAYFTLPMVHCNLYDIYS